MFTLRWLTLSALLAPYAPEQRLGAGIFPVGRWSPAWQSTISSLTSPPRALPGCNPLLIACFSGFSRQPRSDYLGGEPGSPLFVPLFLAVVCAAVGMNLRDDSFTPPSPSALTALIEATSPAWVPSAHNIRDMATRAILIALAGVGAAALTWRLSHEREVARKAQDEQARLEELDRRKSNFISTVSHDLRTPFTAVRAGFGLLGSSISDRLLPDERELLDDMGRTIERLGMYINDLVTFNQLEAGVLRIENEPLDLRAVVANAIVVVHPLIHEKGQILEVDLPEPLPHQGLLASLSRCSSTC